MKIITNNPLIRDELETEKFEIDYVDESYLDVLYRGRDLIHKNWSLLTHPLYGSVKPNETVYRTLVLKEGSTIDFSSLSLIEDAIGTAKVFKRNAEPRNWPDSILDDFQVIDFDLIKNALDRMIF